MVGTASGAKPPDSARRSPIVRLVADELRDHRRTAVLLAALIVLTASLPLASPGVLGRLTDRALGGESLSDLAALAVALVALEAIYPVFDLVTGRIALGLSWRVSNGLRAKLADHILNLDAAWHAERTAGELVERIDGDTSSIGVFAARIGGSGLLAGLLLTGSAIASFTIHPLIGVSMVVGLFLSGGAMFSLRSFAVESAGDERSASAALYGDIEERLGALDDLRANGAGQYALWRHQVLARRWFIDKWIASARTALVFCATNSMVGLTTIGVLATGVALERRGAVTVGGVLAAWRWAGLARRPLEQLAENLRDGQTAIAASRRVVDVLSTLTTVPAPGGAEVVPLPDGPLELRFDGVTFAYPDRPAALVDLDLVVPAGQHIGLVGRTGSGKTTLGRLAARQWDTAPGAGRVLLGGVDLRCASPADLRRRVAVVTQDVVVFRASVRDNLTLFGTVEATDERLAAAMDDADLGGWLRRLPAGFDAEIGVDAGLSGGEAQLLALARALLADPGLVVLDEATARLDPVTEARVARATARLLVGRTAVVIAHRLATLDAVDVVGVLDHGRLIQCGARGALATTEGPFHRLLAASAGGSTDIDGGGDAVRVPPVHNQIDDDDEHDAAGLFEVVASTTQDRVPAIANTLRLAASRWALYLQACAIWWVHQSFGVLAPLAVGLVLDRLATPGRAVLGALLVALAAELTRWLLMAVGWITWDPTYMTFISQQRGIVLRSLLCDPASGSARLPGSPGATMNRLRTDPQATADLADTILDGVGALIAAALVVGLVGRTSPDAAWLIAIPLVVVIAAGFVGGATLRARRVVAREAEARVSHVVADLADGVLTLQLGGGVPAGLRRLDEAFAIRAACDLAVYIVAEGLATLGSAAAGIGSALAVVALVPALASGVAGTGDLALVTGTVGALGFLPRVTSRLIAKSKNAEVSFVRMAALLPADRPLAERAGVVSGRGPVPIVRNPPRPGPDAAAPPRRAGRLQAAGIVARHPGGGGVAADLSIGAGEFVVITGPVGGGKSTLLRAVLGLHPLLAGTIAWDGHVLDQPGLSLRSPRVAYVPQVPRLCSEPLRDAVLLGLDDGLLDAALRAAQLTDDLVAFPHGLATVVGPRGVRLSGGQLQRVAVARSLVRRPALLVVDDLSSALDVATEAALWDDLGSWLADTAVLAVSHRPAVLERADRIITLDAGRVVDVRVNGPEGSALVAAG